MNGCYCSPQLLIVADNDQQGLDRKAWKRWQVYPRVAHICARGRFQYHGCMATDGNLREPASPAWITGSASICQTGNAALGSPPHSPAGLRT